MSGLSPAFMKIWTSRSSLWSGSWNAWTRIKNVSGASRPSNFWNFFGTIQMIFCHDWWPWMKPGYITMTRRQSNYQWSGGIAAHPPPKKFRVQKSAAEVLASIFWDQDGILLVDYLPKGQTINAKYYSSLLVHLKDILKEKHHGKFTKVVLFLHSNVPVHWPLATQKKLAYLGFQCVDHLPCSPDLAPWDYHRFRGLKKQLEGCHFLSDAEVIAATDEQTTFWIFFEWLAKLEQWAKKCIKLHGEYVE